MYVLLDTVSNIILAIAIPLLVIFGVAGLLVGHYLKLKKYDKTIKKAKADAETILLEAQRDASKQKKDAIAETKQEISELRREYELDLKERRAIVVELENKAIQKERALDQRSLNLDKKEDLLDQEKIKLNNQKELIDADRVKANVLLGDSQRKLDEISKLTEVEAKEIILNSVRAKMTNQITQFMIDEEIKAKDTAKEKAKELIADAVQKLASDTISERTVTVVNIPSDEIKGKIIGREGRNIRTIEALTGVDLIIDDTPEAVVLSGFDPIRREVAKRSLEYLIADGRIHPARIEEVVDKARNEVEVFIREKGEAAIFELNLGKVHPDLIKYLGKLHFRTSYGQNALKHSIETAFLAGKLAVELGEDEILARRAGLLHDIGKAIDHEIEGTHTEIGVGLASRYKEPDVVSDAIASHHGEKPARSVIAVLVAAADALSAARPGARNENVENYIKRLEQLEKISSDIKGVEKAYAISAGREVRVIVKPEEIDELKSYEIAREIKEKIENSMSYPGQIKVTVIRETRAQEIAK
ncbi:MAG: ribonuclease Y [Acholeplasmatales bacterium]|jgi:ribonuclease Y|nr:ribonuclease Y [Acholeplasmatales bacterium]